MSLGKKKANKQTWAALDKWLAGMHACICMLYIGDPAIYLLVLINLL